MTPAPTPQRQDFKVLRPMPTRVRCRYLKELSFPDPLFVGLRLEKLGNSSVIYQLAVFRGEDSDPSAVGRFVHVYVDRENRRPVAIPAVIRAALQRL